MHPDSCVCGVVHPRSEWISETDPRRQSCKSAQRKRDKVAALDGFDYAKMMQRRIRYNATNTPGTFEHLTADLIRSVMVYQRFQCALLDCKFVLPNDEAIAAQLSWTNWLKTLPKKERDEVPELLRISVDDDWVPGNVVLVSAQAAHLYTICGDAKVAQEYYRQISTKDFSMIAAPAKVIRAHIDKIEAERTLVHHKIKAKVDKAKLGRPTDKDKKDKKK